MPSLKNKRILIGVSGGIAAYKIPELVRLFIKSGAEVQVIMSPSAHRFVTAETLATVSKRPVYTEFFEVPHGEWNNHVELGMWPDLFIIAPATANTISKMVGGVSDNLLLTTYLSARSPVLLVPAMDLDMFQHESTTRNLEQLKSDRCEIMEPAEGELASGLHGKGRMPEPEEIYAFAVQLMAPQLLFSGKKVLVTAGPTYESIDPVRFIGNHSTGKMGFAIARAFEERGAEVTLVSGPVALEAPENVKLIKVQSAEEMKEACLQVALNTDIVVMSAAVADYKPKSPANSKLKKTSEDMSVELVRTPDILSSLSEHRQKGQIIVGFALETNDELNYAKSKLEKKNLDMVVLNSLNDKGAGFGHDTNKVTLVTKDEVRELPLKSKTEVATDIVLAVAGMMNTKKT